MAEPTAVAIVEDDARVRDSVRQIIDAEDDFRSRGAYGSAEQALRALGGTPADLRLLGHLAEGLSYQSAADTMRVSINTVRDHVRVIYEKLHVHSKSAAVSKALRAGLL